MPYQVRLSHINSDYSVVPLPIDTWSTVVEDEDALIIMLNRVAITSSQHPTHEYPVISVAAGSIRATITVIGGQLYYTDPNVLNRSNIKVVAGGALQLLKGSSFESVLKSEAAMINAEGKLADKSRRARMAPNVREHLLIVLLIVLLTDEGQFKLYEMWRSAELVGFTLQQVESLPLRLGSQGDKPALMAGDFYLLLPKGDDRILLNNILFRRHSGPLDNIGKLQ